MPRRLVIAAFLLLLTASLLPAEWDVDGIEKLLPIHETEGERLVWDGREDQMPDRGRTNDPPPTGAIRNCAEWEPCTGVMIRYPLGLPYSLLRDLDDDVMLHVVVSSGSYSSAMNNLSNNGVNMNRVQFLIKPNDSIWTRDYGPWFVFDGSDEIAIIDHTYNRPWRPNDNMIPVYFGQQQGIPVHSHDMYHTGGNYMTDGAHVGMSTRLVYNEAASENGMSQSQVDQLMEDYYGITQYHVLDYIENGGIHHIDTWAKFLDEETVLLKEVWSSHHTHNDLEQRAVLLASLQASTGRNYDVHRVYCYDIGWSDPASYTNSLILNDKIYVPTFGNSTYDNQAIAAYEAAAPGYEVEGYYYSGFLTDDALHCRTKGVMDEQMLRVSHISIEGSHDGPVDIDAVVLACGGDEISSVELFYRFAGGGFQSVAMSPLGGNGWRGQIPSPVTSTTADYYIHATSVGGREEGMPRTEPNHWYTFDIEPGDLSGTETPLAEAVVLHANYPNPFNPSTTFSFELRHPEPVRLAVYDARGGLLRVLIDGECPAGRTEVTWDGRDDRGRAMSSGTYFYRLQAAGIQYGRPATLLK